MLDKRYPTHYRLLAALKAIGPYLREGQSKEGYYLFDCLSVCVDDKPSPEKREFWGWWMELQLEEGGFAAKYHHGCYNVDGNWMATELPFSVRHDVHQTQEAFHRKLTQVLNDKFELEVNLHDESAEFV